MSPRRTTVLLLSLLAVAGAVLATPNTALALPPGTGWAASWSYYTSTSFQYEATVPGARVVGYANDAGGTRNSVVTVVDTVSDTRCARVLLYASDVGTLTDRTVCNGSFSTSTTNFTAGLLVLSCTTSGGVNDRCVTTFVPPSTDDSTLRTVGTGASWRYYTPTSFEYRAERPGVRLVGYGAHQAFDQRSALSTVTHTGASPLVCALGRTRDPYAAVSASTCTPGASKYFSKGDNQAWIEASACTRAAPLLLEKCASITIPAPY